MVILKYRGQGLKKMENYRTNLSRTFNTNLDLVPWIRKLPKLNFSVRLFSNPGDNIFFLLKFNEARISEWNISGSAISNFYGVAALFWTMNTNS